MLLSTLPDASPILTNLYGDVSGNATDAEMLMGGLRLKRHLDRVVAPNVRLGGLFSYSDTSISSNAVRAPGSLDVSSYALGLYGSSAALPNLSVDAQIDGAFNANAASRLVGIVGATASADYDSYTFHAGGGLRQSLNVAPDLVLQPLARLDDARVDAQSYTETGAGALDLAVTGQSYQELMLTGGLRGTYTLPMPPISRHMRASATTCSTPARRSARPSWGAAAASSRRGRTFPPGCSAPAWRW
ncbi:autotransporter outer membrane beta-barrel domain-containing protein [Xanthobacter agilis]|uniref:Uncharacterized protein with beta-barrel porin domain n=1 Tax=Xanthobacter agilis TaxID=47492 RepID=A0ABU0L9Z4_XANAG|nr:uncharacterized protein with beta-barrel porin domain [Xanthobacter agilis]